MYCVFIVESEDHSKCSVLIRDRYTYELRRHWLCTLNDNYIDDIREISAAMSAHTPLGNLAWLIDCNDQSGMTLEAVKRTIDSIIDASVHARVSRPVIDADGRRAIVALGCCRRLPRDLLREVAMWLDVDLTCWLVGLFHQFVYIRSVKGLYIRTVLDGVRGPRMQVDQCQTMWSQGPEGKSRVDIHTESLFFSYNQCGARTRFHFPRIIVSGSVVDAWKDTMEFDADPAIEFTHKRLDKRQWSEN